MYPSGLEQPQVSCTVDKSVGSEGPGFKSWLTPTCSVAFDRPLSLSEPQFLISKMRMINSTKRPGPGPGPGPNEVLGKDNHSGHYCCCRKQSGGLWKRAYRTHGGLQEDAQEETSVSSLARLYLEEDWARSDQAGMGERLGTRRPLLPGWCRE